MVESAANASAVDRPDRRSAAPRALLRWEFLAAVTVVAFGESLRSLIAGTRAGSLIGYVWFMLLATLVAGAGVARRPRAELPVHDRQTDVIVGTIGLLGSALVQGFLLQRYSPYFLLLRIDVIAMWLFVVSCTILLFGLRPFARFIWVWTLPVLMAPLTYQVVVISFGGNRAAAGAGTLLIAAAASAIASGSSRIRAVSAALTTWSVGLLLVFAMVFVTPDASLLAFQMVPATTSLVLVCSGFFPYARRGIPRRVPRITRPLSARQVRAVIPIVLVFGAMLSLIKMPVPATPPPSENELTFGRPLAAPAGWHMTEQAEYPWVSKFHGSDATLIRQRFVADAGDPRWDKRARPRTVYTDAVSTWRPVSLQVFPASVVYDARAERISEPKLIDLGHGVTGELRTAVDEKMFVSFDQLSWTWRNGGSAQRVTIIASDNHDDDAQFPELEGKLGPQIRLVFAVLFRGNAVAVNSEPTFKDAELLTEFGRGLVDAQLSRAGQSL